MDKIASEVIFDINSANMRFVDQVLRLSTKLPLDVARPVFEKRVLSLDSENSATSRPVPPFPGVCSRCFTPQRAGVLHSQLLGCYRSGRSVRRLTAKKRSVLHKLSSRDRMMIDSHNQWSNILQTRCRVCGFKTRRLCPLPGERPTAPSRCQEAKKPHLLKLTVATMNSGTPSRKKKNKNKQREGGLIISEDLKEEIQKTMGIQENNSTNKKRKKSSIQVIGSKSDACVEVGSNNTASKVIEEDCIEQQDISSSGDSMYKNSQGTPKSKVSNQAKKMDTPKVLPNNTDQCKPIATPRANDTPKSKPAAKIEQKHLKQTPSIATKRVNKSSPATKLVRDIPTPPASKKVKSDNLSVLDHDNTAQYGVPLLRINEVKKKQNVRKMQQRNNALVSAFNQSVPPKNSNSIKDFLSTLF